MYLQLARARCWCPLVVSNAPCSTVLFPESRSPLITPILRKPHTDAETAEDGAEARMRQALGKLGTSKPGRPEAPRRATPSGNARSTPAPVQTGRRGTLTLAESGRGGERQPRAPTKEAEIEHGPGAEGWVQGGAESARQVQVLTEQLRATQTRLGYAELVLGEAGRAAQARQEEATGLRQALDAAEATLAQLRAELAASERAREEPERRQPTVRHSSAEADAPTGVATQHKVVRPLGSTNRIADQMPASEPEPVKWWMGD